VSTIFSFFLNIIRTGKNDWQVVVFKGLRHKCNPIATLEWQEKPFLCRLGRDLPRGRQELTRTLKRPAESSGDASSPQSDGDATVAFFPGSGIIAAATGDEGVACTFLRRGVAATLRPAWEFGINLRNMAQAGAVYYAIQRNPPDSRYDFHGWMRNAPVKGGQFHLVFLRQFRQVKVGQLFAGSGAGFLR
jgi:hypothetical protein